MTTARQAGAFPVERRTLFFVQTKPYPLSGGVSLRNWQNINLLAQQGSVALFSLDKEEADLASLPLAIAWEHYDLSKSSRPMGEKVRRRLWRLRPTGHARADWLYTREVADRLRQLIASYNPTLIIIEEIWLYRYLPILRQARCPLILDNHNVEGDDSRYQGVGGVTTRTLTKVRQIEENFIQAVDQVWMCSQEDVRRLYQLYPGIKTTAYAIPNGVNPDYYETVRSRSLAAIPSKTISKNVNNLIYLGRFSYQPNAEAVSILLHQIYPSLKALDSNCQLLLVGCDPTEEMLIAAQADPHIIVTGQVEDVRPYLAAAAVMVVPLQKGSGTRLKLLEAFAAKCPVISTHKGAEGLDVEDEKHLLLRDSPAAMVQGILRLWQQPQTTHTLSEHAYERFLEQYSWSAVGQQIGNALAQLAK
ncbi:glycosyltransferase [Leptolyngbya cf. ectocarpi LEGE 11479]|uniref:Glycosyltransferase n=1 Tax=Leptolyngbya cf. ectocarpi LEGE 11479 TaxID=1828722 RepID=A0A929F874_LEPEC|nr:glycosyltransferase family 4 protein [Leptolyngbya ectocarpi]MBE9068661.1 glycosyltransferase [Leptolyngbya cf. ectocarpi LEGE 11479]